MEPWIKDVEYYVMPAHYPVKGYEKQYYAAYECWKKTWATYRASLGIEKSLTSDGFAVAHEIGAVFYKGECVALSAFTYGRFSQGPLQDLGWWDGWNEIAFQQIKKISDNAMIGSQFTVHPDFAGKGHIVRWKDILSLYVFNRFELSIADVMAGNLNLTKGVNNVCGENSGATIIGAPFQYNFYGVPLTAQLVSYEKQSIAMMKENRGINRLCDDLWSRMIHISEFPVIDNRVIPLRKVG